MPVAPTVRCAPTAISAPQCVDQKADTLSIFLAEIADDGGRDAVSRRQQAGRPEAGGCQPAGKVLRIRARRCRVSPVMDGNVLCNR